MSDLSDRRPGVRPAGRPSGTPSATPPARPAGPSPELQALLEAVGVYDTHTLPAGYMAAPDAPSRGVFIRGGTGSRWLNRLSTLMVLAIWGGVLGGVTLLVVIGRHSMRALHPGPVPVACVTPPPSQWPGAAGGRAMAQPPLLRDAVHIAQGRALVPATAGRVHTEADGRRANELPTAYGTMTVVTSPTGRVQVVRVAWASPLGLCASALAVGLVEPGGRFHWSPERVEAAPATPWPLPGWHAQLSGDSAAVTAIELVPDTPTP